MKTRYWILAITFLLILTACTGNNADNSPAQAVTQPVRSRAAGPVDNVRDTVNASLVVKPARFVQLSFASDGVVEQIFVNPGDQVQAGDLLMQLDTWALELALQVAQQDVVAQQALLDDAVRENAVQISQAQIALNTAKNQLTELRLSDPLPAVDAAYARVAELEHQLAQARANDPNIQVRIAQVEVARATRLYNFAQAEYEKALDRLWEPQDVRDGYANALQQAQWDLQLAQIQLESALAVQTAYSDTLQAISAQIDAAQADLQQAINDRLVYSTTLDTAAAQIQAAQIELDDLLAQRDLLTGTASTEAQARLQQARLQVEQIKQRIHEAQLRAPFEGTVVAVWINAGEAVSERQPVALLADLSQMVFETTDLNLGPDHIQPGQPVEITLDGWADLTLQGHVQEIVLQETSPDGNMVLYTTRIALDTAADLPMSLHWGMTGLAQIHLKQP